jgi:hypothetical protein
LGLFQILKYFDYKFRSVTNGSSNDNGTTTDLQKSFVNAVNITSNVSTVIMLILVTLYGYKFSLRLRIYGGGLSILLLFVITTVLVYVNTDAWQLAFFVFTLVTVGKFYIGP